MKKLDPFAIPLEQACLIEASAGTGKTFTITTLYIRLIASGYPVDSILVVTFTEAAAAELKLRIRQRLSQCLSSIGRLESSKRVPDEGELAQYLFRDHAADPARLRQYLKKAMFCFDQATIMTIHSFCLRTLKEHAFETKIPFDIELAPESSEFFTQAVLDFFARRVNNLPLVFLRFLKIRGFSADYLQQFFSRVVTSPGLPVIPDVKEFQDVSGTYGKVVKKIKKILDTRYNEVLEHIVMHPNLDKRSYGRRNVERWLDQTRDAFHEDTMIPVFDMSEKGDPLYRFTRTRLTGRLKKGQSLNPHDFFDLCETLLEKTLVFEQNLIALKHQFIEDYRTAHLAQKNASGVFYFDDLIQDLYDGLHQPSARELIPAIRKQYRACLIDEFQDTDLLQYRIFSVLFAMSGTPFFMIGDPKQAVYAFRGGDIFAYLKAAGDTQNAVTLTCNYRSDPLLVKGVNHLFTRVPHPFEFEKILFSPVQTPAGSKNRLCRDNVPVQPLQISFVARKDHHSDKNRFITKKEAGEVIPSRVAADIANILNSEYFLTTGDNSERRVQPGDMAILVRKNAHAPPIQAALAALDIPCVISKTGSVFDSSEAVALSDILAAVLEPENSGRFRAALCTEVFGFTGDDLALMDKDTEALNQWLDFFRQLNTVWKNSGFMSMMQLLLKSDRTLLNPENAMDMRALTNIHHLVELLHCQSVSSHLHGVFLLNWFQAQIASAIRETEAHELRLESDKSAVVIVTIHKSKGLEYPLVFLPYLWETASPSKKDAPVFFHDPKNHDCLTLDLGSDRIDFSRQQARQEILSEETRLLYVALTRASSLCRIYWGAFASAPSSALWRLLHQGTDVSDNGLLSDLSDLARGVSDSIVIDRITSKRAAGSFARTKKPDSPLVCRVPGRDFDPRWKISSFSSFIRSAAGFEAQSHKTPVAESGKESIQLASFPKGAGSGDFFHALFETLDFKAEDEAVSLQVESTLRQFGFPCTRWSDVVKKSVEDVIRTNLSSGTDTFCLADIPHSERLNELAFYFKVRSFSPDALVNLFKTGMKDPEKDRYAERLAELQIKSFSGFVKGFVDLVVRHRGKWYIMDYKSNYLGDCYEDYHEKAMAKAMAEHHYYLQYHLYAVALHRYLALRMPSYSFQDHFGGVFYLFIRGMSPKLPCSNGVFFDRPDEKLVSRLSDLFCSRTGAVESEPA